MRAKSRAHAEAHVAELGYIADEFTCDNCRAAHCCSMVFDLYNTNGDCLAEK